MCIKKCCMRCYEKQHNESLEDLVGSEAFLWEMLQPPRKGKLAVVLLETGSGICLQVILTLVTSLGCCSHQLTRRALLPTSCQPASVTLQWSYALNKSEYPVSPYCHDSATVDAFTMIMKTKSYHSGNPVCIQVIVTASLLTKIF